MALKRKSARLFLTNALQKLHPLQSSRMGTMAPCRIHDWMLWVRCHPYYLGAHREFCPDKILDSTWQQEYSRYSTKLSYVSTTNLLIPIEAFDNFNAVRDYPIAQIPSTVLSNLVQRVAELDEREEFEPWIRSILADGAQTPHGPAEIVDIFTHHVTAGGRQGMAAFILKGKSFPTVKPVDVAHQIYRLKKLRDWDLPFLLRLEPSLMPPRNNSARHVKKLVVTIPYSMPRTSPDSLLLMGSFVPVMGGVLLPDGAGAVTRQPSEFLTYYKRKHWMASRKRTPQEREQV